MSSEFDLNRRNKIIVMLVQALWGAISGNFRMVALEFGESTLQVLVVLDSDSASDREEIEDIAAEFDALLLGLTNTGTIAFEVKTVVDSAPLDILDPACWFTVFRRRED